MESLAVEIDQLVHFLKVAETANITRAAEELGLSQPAISRSVQKLEEELGQPLFERQTRKVALTEAGQLFQSRARQILSMIEDTKSELVDQGDAGKIRLAGIPTIVPYFLPGFLKKFSNKYPRANVTVQEDTTHQLLHRLTQGEIDVALLALPIPVRYLQVEELFKEELWLVMSAKHPLIEKEQIKLSDLKTYPFVLLDEAHCLSDSIISFCRHRSFHPISMDRTSQIVTIQELVALDHGISLIPEMAKKLDSSARRVYRSLSAPKPTRTLAAVWNPYRYQSQLLEAFQKMLREYCREI